MEYAKKMALVDPRVLECVPSQPLSANPIGSSTRRLDDEVTLSAVICRNCTALMLAT